MDAHGRGCWSNTVANDEENFAIVDHTIELGEAKRILADAGYPNIGVQGNLDPEILRDGPPEKILEKTKEILGKAGNTGHVMNLGHGIEATTPEPYAALFVDAVHDYKH